LLLKFSPVYISMLHEFRFLELMKSIFFLFLALFLAGEAVARDRLDEFRAENDRAEFEYDETLGRQWKEQNSPVPPVNIDALRPMEIDHGPVGITLYLDKSSLAMNKKDRITRYWLALKNGDRIVSLNFEAIRCSTRQYKQIAYASPRQPGKIRRLSSPKWRKIQSSENRDPHAEIADNYICAGSTPKTTEGVISSLEGDYSGYNPYAEYTDL
jgi:hypothetical protein